MQESFIAAAVRTPIGNLNGALSSVSATELGSCVIQEAVRRTGIEPRKIDEVIVGNVLSAALRPGAGGDEARQPKAAPTDDRRHQNKKCPVGGAELDVTPLPRR